MEMNLSRKCTHKRLYGLTTKQSMSIVAEIAFVDSSAELHLSITIIPWVCAGCL